MNDFAKHHNGDALFRGVMIGLSVTAAIFAFYVATY